LKRRKNTVYKSALTGTNTYFMKKIIVYILFILQWSCQKDEYPGSTTDPPSSAIALEVKIHQITIDQYEKPDQELHPGFVTNEIQAMLQAYSGVHNRNFSSSQTDTVFSYDEIPLVRETRTHLMVYEDGKSETITEDLTPEGINPLYTLTEMPPGDDMVLSRTIIKNGRIQVFNKQNDLLLDEAYPENNLREFLDSLMQFSQPVGKGSKIKSSLKAFPEGMSRIVQGNGTVKIVQEMQTMPQAGQWPDATAAMKAVAVMNDEMTRTLKFELFSGNQLIHRKQYLYEEDALLGNYRDECKISDNPRCVVSETLQLSKTGIPVIFKTRTFYRRNQTFLISTIN
jgi:hypothetical protein